MPIPGCPAQAFANPALTVTEWTTLNRFRDDKSVPGSRARASGDVPIGETNLPFGRPYRSNAVPGGSVIRVENMNPSLIGYGSIRDKGVPNFSSVHLDLSPRLGLERIID